MMPYIYASPPTEQRKNKPTWSRYHRNARNPNSIHRLNPPPDNVKLIEAARKGFSQFQKDYLDEGGGGGRGCEKGILLVQKGEEELVGGVAAPRFGVDEEVFEDSRPVVDFVSGLEGVEGREFRLFEVEDRMNEAMRAVYNVNCVDVMVPWEVFSKRMYPRSVERWPIDVVGASDFSELRGKMLMVAGKKGKGKERGETVSCGLQGLARLLDGEGVDENPMGFLTFAGINLNKLMKELDRKEPITPTFAGPFAEHNFTLDYSGVGATGEYAEYDFSSSFLSGGVGFEGFVAWRNTIRIKKSTVQLFSFEILAFIFYTFYGDALQLLAATELYRRGWRYHKLFQVWISPWTSGRAECQLRGYEPPREAVADERIMGMWPSGVYVYFHYGRWEFCTREFRVNEGVLEGKPVGFEEGLWD